MNEIGKSEISLIPGIAVLRSQGEAEVSYEIWHIAMTRVLSLTNALVHAYEIWRIAMTRVPSLAIALV